MEINQRIIFVGVDKRKGKYENDVLLIMSKERKSMGFDFIRENYGVAFKIIKGN